MGIKISLMEEPDAYLKKIQEIAESVVYRFVRPWLHLNIIYKLTLNECKHNKLIEPVHRFTQNVINQRRKLFISKGERRGLLGSNENM